MSNYMEFVYEKINRQEKSNEQIVLDYWKQVSETGNTNTKYASLLKKIIKHSEEECLTPKELATNLLKLDGLGKIMTLKYWVIKAERQNLNEVWKKEYIEKNTNIKLFLLPKSGKESLHLDENFLIKPRKTNKSQSDKSKGIKSFDFILKSDNLPKTEGFDGILVVDKTVKVTGGSQIDVQKEIDNTISHLCSDPLKRRYMILLDGNFFHKYVQENKDKCKKIIFTTTDELIKTN